MERSARACFATVCQEFILCPVGRRQTERLGRGEAQIRLVYRKDSLAEMWRVKEGKGTVAGRVNG